MEDEDPDENPSAMRAAGWAYEGWETLGVVGALVALAVAAWAKLRRLTVRPPG